MLCYFSPRLVQPHAASLFLQPRMRAPSLPSSQFLELLGMRHVKQTTPPETEHPCHGALAVLKLVAQPPTQLPVTLPSLASLADIDDVEGASAVGDVRGDIVLRAIGRGSRFCGLADCFGASTTTAGSEGAAPSEVVAASE